MKSIWSRLAKCAFAAGMASALAALACLCRNGVETDLYALLDPARRSVLRALADNLGGQLRILLEGPDFASLDAPAAEFKTLVGPHAKAESGTIRETLAAIAPYSAGLLTEETRAELLAGKFDDVAKSSATALVSGFLSPVVSVKQDPYLLATDYLTHLQTRDDHGWTIRDGDPVCERDGRFYRLLVFDGFTTSDSAFICEVADKIRSFNESVPRVKAYASGAPFHAAMAMENSKMEINVLSVISLVVVFVLGWGLFRSVRFVIPLGATIACAFLVATAAVFGVFGKPHLLTFVFGTSLIGLGVDYVYHAYSAEDVRAIRRPLTYALLTTLACFVPLAFSSVSVLRQMALFTCTGLVTAWASVLVWHPGGSGVSPLQERSPGGSGVSPLQRMFLYSLVLLLGTGVFRIHLNSDPSNFYRPYKFLADGEKKFLELNKAAASRFTVIGGTTMQDALEQEEAYGVKGLSAIIPSLKRQRENAALIRQLREKTGEAYTAMTGVPVGRVEGGKTLAGDCDESKLIDPDKITDPLLLKMMRPMCVRMADRVLLVSPCVDRSGETPLPPGVRVIEPKMAVAEMFDAYAREVYRLLGISFGILVLLLVALFRKKFLACAVPVAAASLATLAVLGWCGVPLTFFHALCFFIFTGLGLDYAIFHLGNPATRTRRVVFVSFLTSCVAFGMLAFTSFAVTRAMGGTLALGLFFAYLFSAIPRGGCAKSDDRADGEAWYAQPERGAGRLRMAFMWGVYSLFGKTALKIATVPVAVCIYLFARPVRNNLRKFYGVLGRKGRIFRHILDFAWSIADKVDACTLKKDLPKLAVRDDVGSRAFRDLVASGKGAFLVSTHLGTVEVLPALAREGGRVPHMHAFQQMGHDAVFTHQFASHLDTESLTLHAVEEIGVETAVQMQASIEKGDLVLMAGDRVSAGSKAVLRHDFMGRPCEWPKGVFVFVRLMECPVFFVTCVRTGWNAYEAHFEKAEGDVFDAYVRFLESEARARPDQWHHFHDIFSHD